MNWRVLIGILFGAFILVGGAFAAWYVFLSGKSGTPTVSPTPISTDAGGLPVTSTPPGNTSPAPVLFRGVCPDTWAGQKDTDGDGLPDSVEAIYGTNPNNPDTDGDGYNDGAEVRTGHDPLNPNPAATLDSDHDGLTDNVECTVWHTDPFNPDSDGDGFSDGAEVKNGFDPTKKGDGHGSDRLPTPTPASRPTPVPTYSANSTVTPIPAFINSPTIPPTTPPTTGGAGGNASVNLIAMSQLHITNQTSSADVKTYLATIDSLRPQELSDGTTITNAIQSAASGNVAPLTAARTRIQQFSVALKGVSVAQNAAQYHQLYVSLIDFTVQQLQLIEQNATSNQQVAAQAVLAIQNALPNYVTQLSQLRQTLQTLAGGS